MQLGSKKPIKNLIFSTVCILVLFFCNMPRAAEKLTIASSEIPNLISEKAEHKGLYNDFLNTMPELNLIFMPPPRIEIELKKEYIDCIFPASSQGFKDMTGLIESLPIKEIGAYVFSNDITWKEKRYPAIAIRHGFEYGNIRASLKARYVELPSDLDSAKMLTSGRVDAMIGYLSDLTAALKLLDLPIPKYDQNKPIYIQKDAMICHENSATRVFVEQFNANIIKWREAGLLE
jgi:ABC-type amino acid transport substrate-binding protein